MEILLYIVIGYLVLGVLAQILFYASSNLMLPKADRNWHYYFSITHTIKLILVWPFPMMFWISAFSAR